jgi:peptidoglycan glycosyltransferase
VGLIESRQERSSSASARRRRARLRGLGLGAILAAGAAVGWILASGGPDVHKLVGTYVRAWVERDYSRMYSMLDPSSRQRISEPRFVAAYEDAARTATLLSLRLRSVGGDHRGTVPVTMVAHTSVFGTLRERLLVPVDTSGSTPTVRYSTTLLFPGLRLGERLSRVVALPPRATLLARDGTPLAQGPGRTSPIPDVAGGIVGVLGPIPAAQANLYAAQGYPVDAKVGLDGLERIFQPDLAGRPGGTLRAGRRVLARTGPVQAPPVRTTIDPGVERAAIAALGGRFGGIAAMDPRTGGVLALVGLAFSVLQPPGSTMKIVTVTAALQAGIVKLTDTFPVSTSTTLDGYTLQNANGEACGGTLLNAFAVSCNSVFAPLGAKVGARRLVAMAQRFGFDQTPSIPGAAESQIPSATTIGDDLAVGSSAIGQGRVEASALEMTDVAATIAMGGRRPIPTLRAGAPARFVRVTTPRVAHLVQRMMVAVVEFGTGTSASISGVAVAGKTGTAELANTATNPSNPKSSNANNPKNTDAWFVGYAPVGSPRIVAGGLFPGQGAGGATAAPAVRGVLIGGLQAH